LEQVRPWSLGLEIACFDLLDAQLSTLNILSLLLTMSALTNHLLPFLPTLLYYGSILLLSLSENLHSLRNIDHHELPIFGMNKAAINIHALQAAVIKHNPKPGI
jgi:hypothetical protein